MPPVPACASPRRDPTLRYPPPVGSWYAPGMRFAPLAFADPCSSPNPDDPGCPPNRFYAYGVIARLALLAASIELEQTEAALDGEAPSSAA